MFRWIKSGFEYGYPVCCVLWFETGYSCMRKKGGLFSIVGKKNLNEWESMEGRIMCPDCAVYAIVRPKL